MTPWKGRAVAAAAAAPGRWPGPRRLWHPRPWESRAAMEQASAPSASEETQASLLEKRAGHRLAACPWQLLAVAELASAGEPASRSAWLARLPCVLLPQPVSVSAANRASAGERLWLFSSRKSLSGRRGPVLIADKWRQQLRCGPFSNTYHVAFCVHATDTFPCCSRLGIPAGLRAGRPSYAAADLASVPFVHRAVPLATQPPPPLADLVRPPAL